MNESRFPAGWDEPRVKQLIQHYDGLTEEEQVAEDEAAVSESPGQSVIAVPTDLLPAIRQMLVQYEQGK